MQFLKINSLVIGLDHIETVEFDKLIEGRTVSVVRLARSIFNPKTGQNSVISYKFEDEVAGALKLFFSGYLQPYKGFDGLTYDLQKGYDLYVAHPPLGPPGPVLVPRSLAPVIDISDAPSRPTVARRAFPGGIPGPGPSDMPQVPGASLNPEGVDVSQLPDTPVPAPPKLNLSALRRRMTPPEGGR